MVAQAVDEKDVLAFRLLQQIAQLMFAIIGVYREQHGPDLGRGELQGHPVGHIGGPDRHLFAFPHAQGHEAPGELVHHIRELTPGLAVVAVGVDKGLPVGKTGHGIVKNLPQGPLAQFKLRLPLAYFFVHVSFRLWDGNRPARRGAGLRIVGHSHDLHRFVAGGTRMNSSP